jgi:GntR family transcriptional regulator
MSNSTLSNTFARVLDGVLTHGEPLPAQIARRLADSIHGGEPAVGTRLPSEPQLAGLFGVSRNTVREAVRQLIAEGIVESRKGVGTFVRSDGRHVALPVETGIEELTSTTELIRSAGYDPGCRDYELEVIRASTEVSAALELEPETFVYRLSRVRLADREAVMFCEDFLPVARIDEAVMRGFAGAGSLFAFLEQHGMSVKVARTVLRPALPEPEIAEALGVAIDQPILLLRQVHFDHENKPFLYSENTINSGFIEFQVRRVPSARASSKGGVHSDESRS